MLSMRKSKIRLYEIPYNVTRIIHCDRLKETTEGLMVKDKNYWNVES